MKKHKFVIKGRPIPKKRPRLVYTDIKKLAYAILQYFSEEKEVDYKGILKVLKKYINTKAYTPKATKNYEKKITYLAKCNMEEDIIEEQVEINIKFYFKDNKEGDIDNYSKAILDGLQPIIKNDKQVKRLTAEKWMKYDENGNVIKEEDERTEVEIKILN